jgi:hypothetical protein
MNINIKSIKKNIITEAQDVKPNKNFIKKQVSSMATSFIKLGKSSIN